MLCKSMFPSTRSYTHDIRDFIAVDNTALNVVCNQEYAQVVPHVRSHTSLLPCSRSYYQQVHYHIIPAPKLSPSPTALDLNQNQPPTAKDMHRQEYESRDGLDENDAHALVERIKAHL
jgi:son of sevenless-like protein